MRGQLVELDKVERDYKQLKQVFHLYREIVKNMAEGVVLIRASDSVIVYTNPKFEEMFGYSSGELIGEHISVLNSPSHKSPEETAEEIMKGLNESGMWHGKVYNKKKDGTAFWCQANISTLESPQYGTVWVAVHENITERLRIEKELGEHRDHIKEMVENRTAELQREIAERKQAAEKLKQTLAELERSNKELEQFAYVASHDLQEPLRMVASYVQLLERRYKGRLDADADDFIGYAVDGASRMQRLINDLLSYSRVSTREEEFKEIDCVHAFGEAIVNLREAIEKSGAVVMNDELPTIKADNTQLVQLFQNLIDNAIKFQDNEPPQIHVSARRKGKEWIFSVRDNGIGIDPQYAERIFAIFQRLHEKGKYSGTGIGLAVCKRIVERHGGRIWVESKPGKGSTFFFTIPM